jgi:hypothetical protein
MAAESPQALRVFISYARRDAAAFAEELLAGLEAAGFDAFLDRHDIAAGEDWQARLGALLQQADTVVYVLSPASVGSERCAWEVSQAEALAKRIIPVVALDVGESDTPDALKRLNYIFFSPGHPFGVALRDLSAALRTDVSWIREHTRLGDLAARWRDDPKPERLLLGSELALAKGWMTAWKAGAPVVTDAHREFIRASDDAEAARTSEERKRLDQIAAAQADRERVLAQSARTNKRWATFAAILALAASLGGFVAWRAGRQLEVTRVELEGERSQREQEQQANTLKQAQLLEAQQALQKAQELLAQSSTAAAGGAANSRPLQSASNSAVREALRQANIAQGWDADIFWCGGAGEAANKANAERVQAILSTEQTRQLQQGRSDSSGLPFQVGRVRLRELQAGVNARPGYQIRSNLIRGEAGETMQAETLRRFIGAQNGPTLTVQTSSQSTPYYLSVFLCG